jgi:hypothetical protein
VPLTASATVGTVSESVSSSPAAVVSTSSSLVFVTVLNVAVVALDPRWSGMMIKSEYCDVVQFLRVKAFATPSPSSMFAGARTGEQQQQDEEDENEEEGAVDGTPPWRLQASQCTH